MNQKISRSTTALPRSRRHRRTPLGSRISEFGFSYRPPHVSGYDFCKDHSFDPENYHRAHGKHGKKFRVLRVFRGGPLVPCDLSRLNHSPLLLSSSAEKRIKVRSHAFISQLLQPCDSYNACNLLTFLFATVHPLTSVNPCNT